VRAEPSLVLHDSDATVVVDDQRPSGSRGRSGGERSPKENGERYQNTAKKVQTR
jgi:hypothetical protein